MNLKKYDSFSWAKARNHFYDFIHLQWNHWNSVLWTYFVFKRFSKQPKKKIEIHFAFLWNQFHCWVVIVSNQLNFGKMYNCNKKKKTIVCLFLFIELNVMCMFSLVLLCMLFEFCITLSVFSFYSIYIFFSLHFLWKRSQKRTNFWNTLLAKRLNSTLTHIKITHIHTHTYAQIRFQ